MHTTHCVFKCEGTQHTIDVVIVTQDGNPHAVEQALTDILQKMYGLCSYTDPDVVQPHDMYVVHAFTD